MAARRILIHWKTLLEAVRFILGKFQFISSHGNPFRIIFHLFAHILSAQHISCLRITYSVRTTHIVYVHNACSVCATHTVYVQHTYCACATYILCVCAIYNSSLFFGEKCIDVCSRIEISTKIRNFTRSFWRCHWLWPHFLPQLGAKMNSFPDPADPAEPPEAVSGPAARTPRSTRVGGQDDVS